MKSITITPIIDLNGNDPEGSKYPAVFFGSNLLASGYDVIQNIFFSGGKISVSSQTEKVISTVTAQNKLMVDSVNVISDTINETTGVNITPTAKQVISELSEATEEITEVLNVSLSTTAENVTKQVNRTVKQVVANIAKTEGSAIGSITPTTTKTSYVERINKFIGSAGNLVKSDVLSGLDQVKKPVSVISDIEAVTTDFVSSVEQTKANFKTVNTILSDTVNSFVDTYQTTLLVPNIEKIYTEIITDSQRFNTVDLDKLNGIGGGISAVAGINTVNKNVIKSVTTQLQEAVSNITQTKGSALSEISTTPKTVLEDISIVENKITAVTGLDVTPQAATHVTINDIKNVIQEINEVATALIADVTQTKTNTHEIISAPLTEVIKSVSASVTKAPTKTLIKSITPTLEAVLTAVEPSLSLTAKTAVKSVIGTKSNVIESLSTAEKDVITGITTTGATNPAYTPEITYTAVGKYGKEYIVNMVGNGYKKLLSDTANNPIEIKKLKINIDGTELFTPSELENILANTEIVFLYADATEMQREIFTLSEFISPMSYRKDILEMDFNFIIDGNFCVVLQTPVIEPSIMKCRLTFFYEKIN